MTAARIINFRTTYVEGPEVQIRNDLAALKRVDSPYADIQVVDIAKIEDQVPTIVSPGGQWAMRVTVSPVVQISGESCVDGIHDSNENLATSMSWNLGYTTHDIDIMKSLSVFESLL